MESIRLEFMPRRIRAAAVDDLNAGREDASGTDTGGSLAADGGELREKRRIRPTHNAASVPKSTGVKSQRSKPCEQDSQQHRHLTPAALLMLGTALTLRAC